MQLQSESGIWAQADARVFAMLMGGNRTERRMMAADRTVQAAIRRVALLRRFRQAIDAHEHRVAESQIAREFAPSWGRSLVVRMPRSKGGGRTANRSNRAVLSSRTSTRATRAYRTPLVDARGRVALYFRVRYVGLKSKGWRPGLAGEHALYIMRDDALEHGDVVIDTLLSNMGKTPEEIAACWDLLEAVEQGYRANAKVQYRIIWNLPHNLTAEERREMVEAFCEREFGRLGLPWAAAIHEPDQRGDQRNFHAHVIFSIRPCERTGNHEWSIAQEKVNGLTDETGLKVMRAVAAAHMNHACDKADIPDRFTHQTYKERGIDAQRQAHVGPAAMAAHEKGEAVGVIERNTMIVISNEAAFARDHVKRALAATERMVALAARRVDLAAMRNAVNATMSRTTAIANGARSIIRERAARPLVEGQRNAVAKLLEKAAAVRRMIAAQVPDRRAEWQSRRRVLANIIYSGRRIAHRRAEREQYQAAVLTSRAALAAFTSRIEAGKVARAKAAILILPSKPYRVAGTMLSLDISAMNEQDRMLVNALDDDTLKDALIERYMRDRDKDAAEQRERERNAERQRVLDTERRARRDEACRIIRETPRRPYRRDASGVRLDVSELPEAEQSIVLSIEPVDQDVTRALQNRANRDRVDDAVIALCRTVVTERILLVSDNDGNRAIDAVLYRRFDLTADIIRRKEVQAQLDAIAARQLEELAPLVDHVAKTPGHVVPDGSGWTVDPNAPPILIATAKAWRHEPHVQNYLQMVARAAPTAAASIAAVPNTVLSERPPSSSTTHQEATIVPARQQPLLTEEHPQSNQPRTTATSNVDAALATVASVPPQPASSLSGDSDHAPAIDILRSLDNWARQDARGSYTVSDDALHAAGLTHTDVATPAAQSALEAIGQEQITRLHPVLDDRSKRPPFWSDKGAIRLDDRFPLHLQQDVARWGGDPAFRTFVATVWPRLEISEYQPITADTDVSPSSSNHSVADVDPWMQAAAIRQAAMAEGDKFERRYASGIISPGHALLSPEENAQFKTEPTMSEARLKFRINPGMLAPGGGIGG